jgi:hypothetical protein
MNDEQLREIEVRTNAATPGPWERESETVFSVVAAPMMDLGDGTWLYRRPAQTYGRRSLNDICVEEHWVCATAADLEFIVHAREDVPALVAEIRRLREAQR